MAEQKPPKIEFPCDYPIKVMGEAHPEFHQHVLAVMDRHAAGFDRSKVNVRDSRKGRWQSITVVIQATGEDQLMAIFADLKTSRRVQMVL